jgi:hypothetical protein
VHSHAAVVHRLQETDVDEPVDEFVGAAETVELGPVEDAVGEEPFGEAEGGGVESGAVESGGDDFGMVGPVDVELDVEPSHGVALSVSVSPRSSRVKTDREPTQMGAAWEARAWP